MKYDPEKAAAAGNGGLVSAGKDMQHANGHEETARLIGGARIALGARPGFFWFNAIAGRIVTQ